MSEPSQDRQAYGLHAEGVEVRDPDENATIDAIIACMTHESRITADRDRHALRSSRARSRGLQAHRPLGSLMRTYGALSAFGHERDGRRQVERRAIDEVPD